MFQRMGLRLALALCCLAGAGPLRAAPAADPPREAPAAKIDDAPRLDGVLDDAAWRNAHVIADFRQKEPVAGDPASEPTRVRVIYDATHLYIGAELDDREPALVRATELRRDNTLENDDSFAVLLDTYHDHRHAFLFRVNPRGTRHDAIVRNESATLDTDWDEEWHAAAAETSTGWTVEIAIPFKILRFSAARQQTWGLNFERVIKRKNELDYWTAWDRNFAFTHVSQAGHLTGLEEIHQAERLRIRPYVAASAERFNAAVPPRPGRAFGEVGIDDLKVAVTSHLTADFTVNPDFAQSEADAQRVNLTRFSLFFPERRQFFIEGSDSLKLGADTMDFGSRVLELVYTRRIGLSPAGEPLSILAGGKLTGKIGGADLGVLDVQTQGDGPELPAENFLVGRVRKELMDRSYVGGIFTNRQGGGHENRVAGADARFVFQKHLTVLGLVATSSDSAAGPGQRYAVQAATQWESDLVEAAANYVDIEPGFAPGVGYVRRTDRMLAGRFALRPRPGGRIVRQLEFMTSAVYFDDRHSAEESGEATIWFGMDFQSGERITAKVDNQVERLVEPFEIHPGVVLDPRRYEFNRYEVAVQSFNGRRLSGRAEANIGPFYTGRQESYEFAVDYRPGEKMSFEGSYELNDVDLAEGTFQTHLIGIKSNVSFTPSLLSSAYIQYNSTGSLAAVQLRLNYIFRTIDNFYLVYNETRYTDGVYDGRSNRSLIAKVTYSLQR